MSALGRGPRGSEGEAVERQTFSGREGRGREATGRHGEQGRDGLERPTLNREGNDPADSVRNWGGWMGQGWGTREALAVDVP